MEVSTESQTVHAEDKVVSTELKIARKIESTVSADLEMNFYYPPGRRSFKILLLILILIPSLISIAVVYLLLLIPNKGKVIFKQKRIGLGGKEFTIYKFKTLKTSVSVDLEKDRAIIKKNSHAIGLFLRRTGLDEMLQIINVIKGDMNLIGPRPLLRKDLAHLSPAQFRKRHLIKPGILGLWQIRRKYRDDKNYFRYDEFYLKRQSTAVDIYIVIFTLLYMMGGKGR